MPKKREKPEDMPSEAALQATGPEAVSPDGHRPGQRVPSIADLFFQQQGGGQQPSLLEPFLSFSDDRGEWLVRSRIPKEKIPMLLRMIAKKNGVTRGRTDTLALIWYYAALTAGADGKAREEGVKVATHMPQLPVTPGLLDRMKRSPDEGGAHPQ